MVLFSFLPQRQLSHKDPGQCFSPLCARPTHRIPLGRIPKVDPLNQALSWRKNSSYRQYSWYGSDRARLSVNISVHDRLCWGYSQVRICHIVRFFSSVFLGLELTSRLGADHLRCVYALILAHVYRPMSFSSGVDGRFCKHFLPPSFLFDTHLGTDSL